MVPEDIFKSVFYIHAEYILFLAEILKLKGEGEEKKKNQPETAISG